MYLKRQRVLWCVLLCFVTTFAGCSREQLLQPVKRAVVSKSVLHATISDTEAPHTVDSAPPNKPGFYVEFSRRGDGVVYIAKVAESLHVVLNGKAGKAYQKIENVRISPDGQRVAYVVPQNGKQSLVIDGREGPSFDDIGPPVFSPDSSHIAFKALSGEQLNIVVDGKVGESYRRFNGAPVFSSDSAKIAYAEGAEENRPARLVISDLAFNNKNVKESCGDQIVTNVDSSRIASVCTNNGKQSVSELSFVQPLKTSEGPLYDAISHLSFAKNGSTLLYVAKKEGSSYLIMNGGEEQLPKKSVPTANPVISPDLKGAGVIMSTVIENPQRNSPPGKSFLYQVINHVGKKESEYDNAEDLVYDKVGSHHAYAALKDKKWRIVVNGIDGPLFDRAVGPMFSPDGTLLVYRARQDGKRFVIVADANGKTIRQHQSYELVFPPVFTEDGKSLAYGVKDGKELWWKVEKLK
ncbi:MAG: TolB family protein [Desulfuromonadaceae bacterium]